MNPQQRVNAKSFNKQQTKKIQQKKIQDFVNTLKALESKSQNASAMQDNYTREPNQLEKSLEVSVWMRDKPSTNLQSATARNNKLNTTFSYKQSADE